MMASELVELLRETSARKFPGVSRTGWSGATLLLQCSLNTFMSARVCILIDLYLTSAAEKVFMCILFPRCENSTDQLPVISGNAKSFGPKFQLHISAS